jgi:uncharacterized protein YbaA (DUF1428 family)
MAKYVDGFIVPVPNDKMDDYLKLAREAGAIWREYGALEYIECVADDVPHGEVTSFPRSVKLEPDETVIFAWIVYESREQRDRVNEQVMNDPRMKGMDPKSLPFDGKRMIWGGFKTIVEMP